MMWITWRRLRGVFVAAALTVLATMAWALYIGHHAQQLMSEYRHAPCNGGAFPKVDATHCQKVLYDYFSVKDGQANFVFALCVLVLVIASVVGSVAIAGEFDRGTVRWSWTQSITRRRWWIDVSAVALMVIAGLMTPLAITMSWWEGAVQFSGRFDSLTFLIDGWVLVPVAMLATVLAMTLGVFLRRPGWLIVLCVVVVAGGYYVEQRSFRTVLVPPHTFVATATLINGGYSMTGPNDQSDLLFAGLRPLGQTRLPSSAQEFAYGDATATCQNKLARQLIKGPNPIGNETAAVMVIIVNRCDTRLSLQYVDVYIPESQFWTLQDREGALDLGLVALLWWGGWWWVRRTRS